MNKQEYLQRLETCLRHKLSREEIDDIMRDYAEYFEEGRRQSKQDSEISAKLGDPELVAQQLIEESQEQNTEHYSASHPKSKEQNTLLAAVGSGWELLKSRFQEWRHKESGEETPPESQKEPEAAQEKVQEKAPRIGSDDSVLIRFGRCVVKACRWCLNAIIASMLTVTAGMISAGLIGMAAFLEGTLIGALAVGVIVLLLAVFGIILSGFAVVLFGKWAGLAAISASAAVIGLAALFSILLYHGIVKFWKFFVRGFWVGVQLWNRMLHKFEGWLIAPKPAEEEAPKQPATPDNLLPVPVSADLEQDNPTAGKEGC